MKKLIIPVAALVLAFASSAFTAKKTSGVLYQYQGATRTETAIKDINNYFRVDDQPCGGSTDVCGVLLSTDNGTHPDATEFNAEKSSLWDAQQNGPNTDPAIEYQD